MGSAAKQSYGAEGRWDGLWFLPENLKIVTDLNHPLFDERALWPFDEALVQVILASGGIDDPVVVNKNGEIDGKANVEVVDGRQRVKAYIEANKRLAAQGQPTMRIKAITQNGDVASLMETMIGSNEHRRGDSIIVKAKKAFRLIKAGRNVKQAAVTFGVSEVTIRSWVALLDTAPEVQKMVDTGKLAASAALELRSLPREEQLAKLNEIAAEPMPSPGAAPAEAPSAKAIKAKVKQGRPSGRVRSRKEIERLSEVLKTLDASLLAPGPQTVLAWVLGESDSVLDTLLKTKELQKAKEAKAA